MAELLFNDEELEAFFRRFELNPHWIEWDRNRSDTGMDVLSFGIRDQEGQVIRMTKKTSGYLASGTREIEMTVCECFESLLDRVEKMAAG